MVVFPFKSEDPGVAASNLAAAARHPRVSRVVAVGASKDATFEHLDAPIKRVAGSFNPTPYADPLEKIALPQDEDLLDAARELLGY